MDALIEEIDEILSLLHRYCGARAEWERSQLAAFRVKLSGLDRTPTADVEEALTSEFIVLKYRSRILQGASLAAAHSMLIRVCKSKLREFARISEIRSLSEAEQDDCRFLGSVLKEQEDGFEWLVEELQKLASVAAP